MPESVRDRCTRSHEYIFVLSKSKRYYFYGAAIREPASALTNQRVAKSVLSGEKTSAARDVGVGHRARPRKAVPNGAGIKNNVSFDAAMAVMPQWRNKRGVWTIDDHRALLDWLETHPIGSALLPEFFAARGERGDVWRIAARGYKGAHFATFPSDLARLCIAAGSRPGDTVLDPFAGSGTTLAAAVELGRRAVGIELNPEYCAMIRARVRAATPGFALELAAAAE